MPTYNVVCKVEATAQEVEEIKQHVRKGGGQIGQEYPMINGFQLITPEFSGLAAALEVDPKVDAVELDRRVVGAQ